MEPFAYARPTSIPDAIAAMAEPDAAVIAGGTEIVNWMKEGIASPRRLVDISRIPDLDLIAADDDGLRIGALARMSDVADHPAVKGRYPAISEALLKSASGQLRNMASIGGNLLQRTRCPYFRSDIELPCNKRRPGSGCSAMEGEDRAMAIFGWSESCVATHPSDVAVAFAALDAVVQVQGPQGPRQIPIGALHRLPEQAPEQDTTLRPSELIVGITTPASTVALCSHYLKVRERASYEFALVSAAVGLDLKGGVIEDVRIALGGVAPGPWRLTDAETALRGVRLVKTSAVRAGIDDAFAGARPRRHNGFKIELAKRTVFRALQVAGELS